jgi:CheY-like chemotaxis protein
MPLLLLVEDDEDIRMELADLLSSEGYRVCEAADRSSGLDLLRTRKPDLVILDYGLPDPTDGAEFLRTKAADPGVASIPVILSSGFVLPPEMDGVIAMMPKPFDVEAMLELVRRHAGPPEEPDASTAA